MRERYILCAWAVAAALSVSAQEVVPSIQRTFPRLTLPAGKAAPVMSGLKKSADMGVPQRMALPTTLASDTSAVGGKWNYLHQELYRWGNDHWILADEASYTRDKYGRMLTMSCASGMNESYKYDEKGRSCEGITWQGDSIFNRWRGEYDSVVEDFMTKQWRYTRQHANQEWQLTALDINDIRRDSRGNVRDFYIINGLNDSISDHFLHLDYDSLTHQPTRIDVGNGATVFTDLKWHKFNGQILLPLNNDRSLIPFSFYYKQDKNNWPTDGCVIGLKFHIDYDEHGFTKAVFDEEADGDVPMRKKVYTRTVNEDLSEFHQMEFYYDLNNDGQIAENELIGIQVRMVRSDGQIEKQESVGYIDMTYVGHIFERLGYDKYGNRTIYERYEKADDSDQLLFKTGNKNDYVYDESNGTILEMVRSVFDTEEGQYVPSARYVYSDYVRYASTGIAEADVEADAENVPTEVFDLMGRQLGTSVKGLPAGVYVVKKGHTSSKVFVK